MSRVYWLQGSAYWCWSRACDAAWRAVPLYDGKPYYLCR